jgi:hypothetical protein
LKLNHPEFHEFVNTFDILCFVESKTDDLNEIVLPGFLIKMKNRTFYVILVCRSFGVDPIRGHFSGRPSRWGATGVVDRACLKFMLLLLAMLFALLRVHIPHCL